MPTYTYECNTCNKIFEQFYYIKDYNDRPKCCLCGSEDTFRNYIEDVKTIQNSIKKHDSELKTIGDLANRNRDRMSDDQRTNLYNKHNEYKGGDDKPLPKGMNRVSKPKKKIKWT